MPGARVREGCAGTYRRTRPRQTGALPVPGAGAPFQAPRCRFGRPGRPRASRLLLHRWSSHGWIDDVAASRPSRASYPASGFVGRRDGVSGAGSGESHEHQSKRLCKGVLHMIGILITVLFAALVYVLLAALTGSAIVAIVGAILVLLAGVPSGGFGLGSRYGGRTGARRGPDVTPRRRAGAGARAAV